MGSGRSRGILLSASEGESVRESDIEGPGVVDNSDLVFCTHGFSFGILGVVYGDSAVRDRSHFFGAQTPIRTRQAAIKRLALNYRKGRQKKRMFNATR